MPRPNWGSELAKFEREHDVPVLLWPVCAALHPTHPMHHSIRSNALLVVGRLDFDCLTVQSQKPNFQKPTGACCARGPRVRWGLQAAAERRARRSDYRAHSSTAAAMDLFKRLDFNAKGAETVQVRTAVGGIGGSPPPPPPFPTPTHD